MGSKHSNQKVDSTRRIQLINRLYAIQTMLSGIMHAYEQHELDTERWNDFREDIAALNRRVQSLERRVNTIGTNDEYWVDE